MSNPFCFLFFLPFLTPPPKFSREGILRLSQDSAIILLGSSRCIAQASIFATMSYDFGIMLSLLLNSDFKATISLLQRLLTVTNISYLQLLFTVTDIPIYNFYLPLQIFLFTTSIYRYKYSYLQLLFTVTNISYLQLLFII